jgi:hypothetical protein
MSSESQSDDAAKGNPMATFAALASFGLICVSLGCLFPSIDERMILTLPEVFGGLADIRDIINNTARFAVWANPKGVGHVLFPSSPETQEELDDLRRRGIKLVRRAGPSNVTRADNPSLLHRLMAISWCSTGEATNATLPANRAPGCRCIADAYLALVNEASPGNATNATVVNVPVDVRDRVAARVYRCWDQRQVRRSSMCGEICKTHVVGVALFANIIMFLACLAFLLFTRMGENWNYYGLKMVLLLVAGVLCIPYLVRYPEANTFNVAGVAVVVFYLTVSLHKELNPNGEGKTDGVNPFLLCLLQGLPLILSAHTIQLGLAGYGRDVWAVLSFGMCGALLGALLQARFFVFLCCRAKPNSLTCVRAAPGLGLLVSGHRQEQRRR